MGLTVAAKKKTVALTIAGMDSSCGAGVAVDLKAFAALGVAGRSVVTAVTAQSPRAVLGVQGTRPAIVTAQLEAVFAEGRPKAAKCGMLFSGGVVEAVAEFWQGRRVPLVVDPVLAASSGGRLLNAAGARALRRQLLPLAKLVTPNVPEAEALTGLRIREPEEMRTAARALFEKYGCAAVVTGGHLPGKEVVEFFYDGWEELLLVSPRVKGGPWRGTGCRFSAAVAAALANGERLVESLRLAKKLVADWILANSDQLKQEVEAKL